MLARDSSVSTRSRIPHNHRGGLLGLNLLGVSYDDSHKAFVAPETVENVLRAADDLAIPCQVVGNFWEGGRTVQNLISIPDNDRFLVLNERVIPIGRAASAGITAASWGIKASLSN